MTTGMLSHGRAVASLTARFCTLLRLDRRRAAAISHAAFWHDIGKLAVAGTILNKPDRLTVVEHAAAQHHTTVGAAWLGGLGLHGCADVALSHHECWDGSGYPKGLSGAAIPFAARIVSLCDVYAALRENRVYRAALSHEEATRIIMHGDPQGRTRPEMFDPDLLQVFAENHALFSATRSPRHDAPTAVSPRGRATGAEADQRYHCHPAGEAAILYQTWS